MERFGHDDVFAANALHAALRGTLPGQAPTQEWEHETLDELEYAGELMLVQFFALFRGMFKRT